MHWKKMSASILLAIVVIFHYLRGAVDCGGLPSKSREDTFQPLCSRSCRNTSEKVVLGMFSPYQCSCSQSCSVYKDCCYDAPYKIPSKRERKRKTTWGEFVCISLIGPVIGRGRYKAVSSCNALDAYHMWRGNLSLSPVTSLVTNITYINIHCAQCNKDAEHVYTWNVRLNCPSESKDPIEDLRDNESQVTYFENDFFRMNENGTGLLCEFRGYGENFTGVEGLELRSCMSINRKSRCSKSWREKATKQKCKSYVDPVYQRNKAYQNSHCARCNFVNLTDVDCLPYKAKRFLQQKVISPKQVERCMIEVCELTFGKGSLYRTEIIEPTGRYQRFKYMFEDPCVPNIYHQCCDGTRYDINYDTCRKVIRRKKY